MSLLEVRDVGRRYGGIRALNGASFDVEGGSITGLIGPNGAGKTTLFNCICGFATPDSGTVSFGGADVTGLPPDRIARAGLVRTFQIARGLPSLSVIENLMLYGDGQPGETLWKSILRPPPVRRREEALREQALEVLARLELTPVAHRCSADLSGGQKKLVELGRALMRQPLMIMLDEPAAGVNPGLVKRLAGHIQACRADGITFLVIEHDMGLIAELCDHVVVMAEGKRLAQGTFEQIRSDHEVQSAYMGRRS